jgi:hypothetical protein
MTENLTEKQQLAARSHSESSVAQPRYHYHHCQHHHQHVFEPHECSSRIRSRQPKQRVAELAELAVFDM